MLYAIVSVLVILADQLIKLYVSADSFRPMELIPGVLNMTKVENTGGAFGLLGGEIPTYWFIIIAGVFTVLVVIALATRFVNGWLARWSLVLVTAGGISNCIDRVINVRPTGHVVDMFQFAFWKSFPVFNLADIFISVFCIVFIFAILFGRDHKDQSGEDDEFVEDEEQDEEPEEEEIRPVRKSRKALKAEEEADEDEEESFHPAKAGRSSRKARQSKYDEEYEQYKAAQRAREEAEKAAAPAPTEEIPAPAEEPIPAAPAEEPAFDPADPFAEWERANAARKPAPAFVPAQAAPEAVEEPVRPSKRVELKAEPQPAAPAQPEQPAVPETPVVRPARKPAPVVEESASFDLDDILAEFK
ncbi:MAG: signal peptidase II [Oscillospiraceae bacterium]|nr:signal peptidase II [Oscillospiraceae bacterium]